MLFNYKSKCNVSELFFLLKYSCLNSELLYFYSISVFLHTVLYFIKKCHCYQFYAFPVISKPRYFELIVLSLHFKINPVISNLSKTEYVNKSTVGNVLHFIWARTEHSKILQCNSVYWFIRHIITAFLFNQCLSSYCTVFY